MKKILCVTGESGSAPDFGFLERFGFAVEYLSEASPDLGARLTDYAIVIIACETRGTQHARIWNYERYLFGFVSGGGRMLFCAPSFTAWAMVWNAFPALMPVTPFMRSAAQENFAEIFHWDREWEQGRAVKVIAKPGHPVCEGISEWPTFYEGGKPGSFNAYDFDVWLPKPHTDIALRTEDGEVALAFMHFGSGRTAFLLADLHDDGGAAWSQWPDRKRFFEALIKHLDGGNLALESAPKGVTPFAPRVPLVPRAPFAFRPSPRGENANNANWPSILARTDWTMMSDNQVSVNVSTTPMQREPVLRGDGWYREPREELGIGHAKFYPPVAHFDSALSIDVIANGAVLEMLPVAGAYQWQPHLVTNQFQSADGGFLIEKRMTISNDVICVELRTIRGVAETVRLRGFNRYHGFLNASENQLIGQVESGVCFGVATSAETDWKLREAPMHYEAEAPFDGALTVAFSAAMELHVVKERLAAAMQNPVAVFKQAFAKWDAYFCEQVPAFHSDDPAIVRMVFGAFLGYRINLYDIPFAPWCDPHSCPSKMHFDPQWEQDDVQTATIGKWLRDPSSTMRQLLRPFRVGFMLNANAAYGPVDRETRGLAGDLQQYSIPLREVFLFDPRPELRNEIAVALVREEEINDDVTPLDPASGLFLTYNCLGMDDSPRWDLVSPGQKAEWFQSFEHGMVAPDVNATIAHRASFLAELLENTDPVKSKFFHDLAECRKALIREHLWSADAGFFVDRVTGETDISDVLTPMSFTPLLLGSFDEEVASRVTKPLYDPAIFRTPFGLPTVACSHPKFDPMSYWRGSIWSRTNWFAAESLYHGGLKTAAADVTRWWLELVKKNDADLRENFNPITGEKKCATMFTEGLSGAADVYFKNVVGFRPTWAGFDLDPIALTPETPSFSFGPIRYRGHEITIWWDRLCALGSISIDEKKEEWNPGVCRSFAIHASTENAD